MITLQDPWFTVKQIYGSHHTLGLPPTILKEVKYAIQYLSDNNLVQHGTVLTHSKTSAFNFNYKKGVSIYENTFYPLYILFAISSKTLLTCTNICFRSRFSTNLLA